MFGISDAGLFLKQSSVSKAEQVKRLSRFLGTDGFWKVNGRTYDGSSITLHPLIHWSGSAWQKYGDLNRQISITGNGFVSTIITPIFLSGSHIRLNIDIDGEFYTEDFILDYDGRIIFTDISQSVTQHQSCAQGKLLFLNTNLTIGIPSPTTAKEKIFYEQFINISYDVLAGNVDVSSIAHTHFIVVGIKY